MLGRSPPPTATRCIDLALRSFSQHSFLVDIARYHAVAGDSNDFCDVATSIARSEHCDTINLISIHRAFCTNYYLNPTLHERLLWRVLTPDTIVKNTIKN